MENGYKKVKFLIPAEDINMGEHLVKQALPTQNIPDLDPFLLLHHAEFTFNANAPARRQGIDPHPHRGFTPVTFVVDGEVEHRDSRGNRQIAKTGEVQWMHAGAGIIHSERPSQDLVDSNGTQEIIQVWINSPSQRKMKQPQYQYQSRRELTIIENKDEKVVDTLVAGQYNGLSGNINTQSPILVLWSTASKGGSTNYMIPANYNCMLYLIKGSVRIKKYGPVDEKSLVIFDPANSKIAIESLTNSQYLILAGQPINEKIVQSGPYVMNTQTQILEAMRDFQMGKMGVLIEDF